MSDAYCIIKGEGYKAFRFFPFIITLIRNKQFGHSIELTIYRISFRFTIRIEDFF